MESLKINPTSSTPLINFNVDTGIFELSGVSRPEDVMDFYRPVMAWLEELEKNVLAKTGVGRELGKIILVFKLYYFNTASSKFILKITKVLSNLRDTGKNLSVSWHYEAGDEQMREDGEYISEAADLEFEFLEESE